MVTLAILKIDFFPLRDFLMFLSFNTYIFIIFIEV